MLYFLQVCTTCADTKITIKNYIKGIFGKQFFTAYIILLHSEGLSLL